MGQVKQLADIDYSKYTEIRVQELHIDELVLNTEKAACEPIRNNADLIKALAELKGTKLLLMEPINDGFDDDKIRGMILYFVLSDGYHQRALEIYPGDAAPGELISLLYK